MYHSFVSRILAGLSAFALSASAFSWTPSPDPTPDPEPNPPCEVDCDFTRGPDPTASYLEAPSGPYTVSSIDVSRSVSGFGGGTIFYPQGTTGRMGGIAVVPGYLSAESSIQWWGPRLASHGFVVITIATNSIFDQPASREGQLSAALDYLVNQSNNSNSPIFEKVDANRVAAMGWSMGGGGALRLASGTRLSAVIPLAPWHSGSNNFSQIDTPTMIIGCEWDGIAPVGSHASPFYNQIPASTEKAYLEINDGDHWCANGGGTNGGLLGKYGVSWMKRFVDLDTRYSQFLCGPNHAADPAISEYRDTCNY